ncbi:MAG: PAS domain S-box protein [Candidatus Methylomirabilis sp.]|nr:PAS domain S-box protein [Candidatus Methylomirabilis sp.]
MVLLVVEFRMYRSVMTNEMRSMADVIGMNSRAALAFRDPAAGERTLAALAADPRITAARLYTQEGQLFATYRRNDINPDLIPTIPPPDGLSLRMRNLTFAQPIRLDDERIGTIYLQFDMAPLYDFLLKHALVVIAVLGLASFAALVLSSRLQGMISGPVVHLAQMVKAVTEKDDYSVRASKSGEDELGLLTDGFNEMLARIQKRDAALQQARDELEDRVNLRTQELQLEVAERKYAEASLKASEEKYRTLVEASQDAIFINHNNRIVYVNPATVTLLGAERPEQILNRSPFDFVHPHAHETVRKRIKRLLEEGTPVPLLEEQYVRLDGTVIDVEVAATPLFYKGEQAIQVVVRDITERRRAQEALRKLSGAVEQAAYSVVITDREGVIEYVNPGFEQLTGYSRDEAIGRTPRLVKSGRHPAEYYEQLWQTLLSGEVFRGVFVNKKKDGTLFFDEEVITPLRDSQGAITHFISVGIDVTERKRAEADLALAHSEMARLYEQTKEDAARWEALFTLSRLLNRSLVLEDVFETFAQAVRSYIAYDRLGVIVAEGGRPRTIYASVPDPSLVASQGEDLPERRGDRDRLGPDPQTAPARARSVKGGPLQRRSVYGGGRNSGNHRAPVACRGGRGGGLLPRQSNAGDLLDARYRSRLAVGRSVGPRYET